MSECSPAPCFPTNRLVRRCLFAVATLWVPLGSLHAQSDEMADPMTDLLEIWAHHPLTGEPLPASAPYPFQGKTGDGLPDRIPYDIVVWREGTDEVTPTARDIGDDLVWGELSVTLTLFDGPRPDWDAMSISEAMDAAMSRDYVLAEERFELNPNVRTEGVEEWESYVLQGELDLPFDVVAETVLHMRAVLERGEVPPTPSSRRSVWECRS